MRCAMLGRVRRLLQLVLILQGERARKRWQRGVETLTAIVMTAWQLMARRDERQRRGETLRDAGRRWFQSHAAWDSEVRAVCERALLAMGLPADAAVLRMPEAVRWRVDGEWEAARVVVVELDVAEA